MQDELSYKRIQEINIVREQHKKELEGFWLMTSQEECNNLTIKFLEELRENWQREFLQLKPKKLPEAIKTEFRKSISQAYTVGCMRGSGWISEEHLADLCINLGDHLAQSIQLAFKGTNSNGNAFASGFTAVAARGYLKAQEKLSSVQMEAEKSVQGTRPIISEKANQVETQEFAEESLLPPEIFKFLIEITPKALQTGQDEKIVAEDQASRIKLVTDKLKYFAEDSARVHQAQRQLLELIRKAHHASDFRLAIGWLRWLMVLQSYSGKYLQDSSTKEELREHYGVVKDLLQAEVDAARQAKDWDALLLAAGLCNWLGLTKWVDETLAIVQNEIGDGAIADRIAEIKRKPRMFVDELLVRRLERR